MLLIFEFFLVISKSSARFPSLVPNFRMLNSFLLQTWSVQMLTSLGIARLYDNSFCTNLSLSNELSSKCLLSQHLIFIAMFLLTIHLCCIVCLVMPYLTFVLFFVVFVFCASCEIGTSAV
jgi:hypothetical protein